MKNLILESKRKLSSQLLIGIGTSLVVVAIAAVSIIYTSLRSNLQEQVQQRAIAITYGLEFASEGLIEDKEAFLLERIVQNYSTLPTVLEVSLVDPYGKVLAHSRLMNVGESNLNYGDIHPHLVPYLQQTSENGKEINVKTVIDGKPVIVQFLPFSSTLFKKASQNTSSPPQYHGVAIAVLDLQEIEGGLLRNIIFTILVSTVSTALIIICIVWLIRRLVLIPLTKIQLAIAISEGSQEISLPALPNNEIGSLGTALVSSFEQLKAYREMELNIAERKYAEVVHRYELATQSAQVWVWDWDIRTDLFVLECGTQDWFGYDKSQIPNRFDVWLSHIYIDDRGTFQDLLQNNLDGKTFEFTCEHRLLDAQGNPHWFLSRGQTVFDDNGKAIRATGTINDIAERKQAEELLRQQAERESLLLKITRRIRQSFNLEEIFSDAVTEIRLSLNTDRVGIFKFDPDSNFNDGEFVAESVLPEFTSALAVKVHDHCFGDQYAAFYEQGRIQDVSDIYNADLTDCHIKVLSQFQIRANLVLPLINENQLWGLICIHQCASPRIWEAIEIDLLQQITTQLAIAIQQASLYKQLQEELLIRQQAQSQIAQQLRQQQTLETITNKIRESLNIKEVLALVTQQVNAMLSGDRTIVFQLFENGNSQIVEETVDSDFPKLKDLNWENEVWSQEILNCYWQGKPRIVPDVMNDIWTECLVKYSTEGQIKSKIIAPILQEADISENHRWVGTDGSKKLWGVLVVHACGEHREWQESEAQLLQQIANQLAIAIQQSTLIMQLQLELKERQHAETQLTETNQRLEVSNDELVRATKMKDEFLANMSHELRTPLNSILGMNEALQDQVFGVVNERQIKALQTVEGSATHLLALINDILDVSKIESGQVTLDLTATGINSLCESSLVFIKQQAHSKRIQVICHIPQYLPQLKLDERRIRQVLINLLNNAVKFTPEGGKITLDVTRILDKDGQTSFLSFAVIDTGIGIAAENISKLFQPFIQIDSALNRQYVGTGLGLALVKRIAELHGGQVKLTSELGVGSRFTVELPFNIAEPDLESTSQGELGTDDSQQVNDENAVSPLILLADDNKANIITFSSYLEAKGYTMLIANNGQEAIDLAKSHQPALILIDIQMPVLDGLAAMKLMRLDPTLVNTPIVALTALAMAGDREKCLEAGANEYLTKPIRLKTLADTIRNVLKNRN
jgi:PAS domain S-box-containing protein